MFQAGKTNNVTFKVNVMGTSSTPSVRVVLGTNPEMSYPATNTSGDTWSAPIAIPAGTAEGTYSMRVEVVLNNRLFTPISKSVAVGPAGANPVDVPAKPEVVMPQVVHKMPELATKTDEDAEGATVAGDIAVHADRLGTKPIRRPILPTIAVQQPVKPKVTTQTQGLSMLKSFAEAKAKKMPARIVTNMPKPGSVKVAEKISLASVDAITGPAKTKITETIKAAKPKKASTIKLIKEQLYYE